MPEPAQKTFVEQFIDWNVVEARLSQYEAIGRAFPLELLRRRRDSPPYFCHYMAWRLGTWVNEQLFERLEKLLRHAESLPNWESERSLLEGAEFADYLALVWQLQLAEYLSTVGTDVQWSKGGGPDLSVRVDGTTLFVECFVFRKSFGIAHFLEEVLAHVGNDIKQDHDYCLEFTLPKGQDTTAFLDKTLRPFLDQDNLARWRAEASHRWPIKIVEPASTLVIYLEGEDVDNYDPAVIPDRTGEPARHIPIILREAITQKTGKNSLGAHHPNLVAVNYVLSPDAQLAFGLRKITGTLNLGPDIDALAIAALGIDQTLSRSQFVLVGAREPKSPVIDLVACKL